MNRELWDAHLTARIRDLEAELKRVRAQRDRHRYRAAHWSARAIDAATQLREARTPDAQQLPARYPRVNS